jgi:hypothetical protein
MMRISQAGGASVALAVVCAVAWLSHVPIPASPRDDAMLRVAFRARPERIEVCVEQSPEALAALPPHMRRAQICEGTTASYRLEVRRDGVLVADAPVRGGGLRQDRPLYVFREVSVPPGPAVVAIRFVREGNPAPMEQQSQPPASSGSADLRQAIPSELVFERRVTLAPREVLIVSYDPDRRELYAVENR